MQPTDSADSTYLDFAADFYREAAAMPQPGLCCTTTPLWNLPGLKVPARMLEMNYGCGTTVNMQDLARDTTVLYVGVGGGLEALQFAYFTRRAGGVIAVDRVPEMLAAARRNFEDAARVNDWFEPEFVELRRGDALELPVASGEVRIAAQNCLFNIFAEPELYRALREMHRVLGIAGKLVVSDPVSTEPIPTHLRDNERLRAMCLSGALTLDDYVATIVKAGFGTIEVRSRQPYRVLDPVRYGVERHMLLESVEIAAIKDVVPEDGACVFTGRTAIYVGSESAFDDGAGHVLERDMPLGVCDKTAHKLAALGREDLIVTASTYHYRGGGCC